MTEQEARYTSVASMTPGQVREAGMRALASELGPAGLIRFLQQFERGSGDYSRERHALLDDQGLDEIVARIRHSRGSSSSARKQDPESGRLGQDPDLSSAKALHLFYELEDQGDLMYDCTAEETETKRTGHA